MKRTVQAASTIAAAGLTLVAASAWAGTGWFAGTGGAPGVEEAHERYLARDFRGMTESIRTSLMAAPGDAALTGNLMDLLRGALKENDARVPTQWKLPAGVETMRFGVNHRFEPEENRIRYRLTLSGELTDAGLIEQLQVIRYPDAVVIDKQAGIGEWSDEGGLDGSAAYWAAADSSRDPIPMGLYLINVKVKGQPLVQGYVLNSIRPSSESPVITAPAVGATVNTGNPVVSWNDFTSPQYVPGEARTLSVYVSDPANDYKGIWEFWTDEPEKIQSIAIGAQHPNAAGVKALKPGIYYLQLKFNEQSRFGEVRVRRQSTTQFPFTVAP
jgi:hypothetical protein